MTNKNIFEYVSKNTEVNRTKNSDKKTKKVIKRIEKGIKKAVKKGKYGVYISSDLIDSMINEEEIIKYFKNKGFKAWKNNSCFTFDTSYEIHISWEHTKESI